MTSYIVITDEETDPGAPVTSELLKKERDNPIAMAEGATGAPKVKGIALSNVYLTSFTQSGTTPQSLTGAGNYKELRADILSPSMGDLQIGFSSSGVFSGWTTIVSPSTGQRKAIGNLYVNMSTGSYHVRLFFSDSSGGNVSTMSTSGVLTVPVGVDELKVTQSGSGPTIIYDWYVLSGKQVAALMGMLLL